MSIFLLLLLLSIDGRSSVRIALCKAFKLFEGSLHLQVLLPLFREHELSHFRVGMFVKVSDHIIEHRVLLRQIICEFAAEFPPRFGRSIGRGLDLAVGQEIKHLALVLLYMFAAHLIGHIPRNFLLRQHHSYFFMSCSTSSSSWADSFECRNILRPRLMDRQDSEWLAWSAKQPTQYILPWVQRKGLSERARKQMAHFSSSDDCSFSRKVQMVQLMLMGRSRFQRRLSKRSLPWGSSKSDIVIKIYKANRLADHYISPKPRNVVMERIVHNRMFFTQVAEAIHSQIDYNSMKRSEYQPNQTLKLPTLARLQSGISEPPTPTIPRPPKTSDELFNDQISEQLEYINKHINPILSKLMIRIINEDPKDMVEYMIQYLKSQEELESKNEFNATLSKTISLHKRMNAGRSERKDKDEEEII